MRHIEKIYDYIIIGSGFGGSMTAKKLVEAGKSVLMIERGEWVERGPHNWGLKASIDLTPHYDKSLPYEVVKGGNKAQMGVYSCVGGPSVFYGGVSFRFREGDFSNPSEIVGSSGAEWPISYNDLEPYYTEAESILGIAGESGVDPTEPHRSANFPQAPAPLADISKKLKAGAESQGLKPFSLPMAINHTKGDRTCQLCTTCDTFACAISAKNDLATVLIPQLQKLGMDLMDNTIATQLVELNGSIDHVILCNKTTEETFTAKAKHFIVAAGALGSPHLLLASGLDKLNPGGKVVGRYLMRHVNSIIFGIYPGAADKQGRFHKEIAILDYYFGHKDISSPKGKLGSLQQISTPPAGLVENEVPGPLGKLAGKLVKPLTGLLAIAEDQPQYDNYITIDPTKEGKYGLPVAEVSHEYTERDTQAVNALAKQAKKILKKAGAILYYTHHIRTFSHSAGTVRMGVNPETSALDKDCNFRGVTNLSVVDASFMPTSAAVNPSLTISANALRVGDYLLSQDLS